MGKLNIGKCSYFNTLFTPKIGRDSIENIVVKITIDENSNHSFGAILD